MAGSAWIAVSDPKKHYRQHRDALCAAMIRAADSGRWLNGEFSQSFGESFARYVGVDHCIPVGNGTDALELCMRAIMAARRIRGRKVITVANAGGYTTSAALLANLTPVYVDVEERSQLMSVEAAIAAVDDETAMIVVTHLYGGLADVAGLRTALRSKGRDDIPIIEDCAQAHGAAGPSTRAGAAGDLAAFSFYPTKNLGALGDAGAVVTSDKDLAATVLRLHQYGWSEKYVVETPGGRNSRMDEMHAAVLCELLPLLDGTNQRRQAILNAYREAASEGIVFVESPVATVAHLAVALCARRDELRDFLRRRNIATDIHYPILDCDQQGWAHLPREIGPTGLDVSRTSVPRLVTVPCYPAMSDGEVDLVCSALSEWTPQ